MDKREYRYFISCNVLMKVDDKFITSSLNEELIRDSEIRNIDDIKEISRNIERDLGYPINSVVVMNYQLF